MKTPFDQYPEYEYDPTHPSEPVQIKKRDDFQAFLITHQGHPLEYLKIIENSFISEKNYLEPVKTLTLARPITKKKSLSLNNSGKKLKRNLDIRLSLETVS